MARNNFSVILVPTPSFTIGPVEAVASKLTITSTTAFPQGFSRGEYALFALVKSNGRTLVQPLGDPLTDETFVLELPADGVYTIQLAAFPVENNPRTIERPLGKVFYDLLSGILYRQEANGPVKVRVEELSSSEFKLVSAPLTYLQTRVGEVKRNKLVAAYLDIELAGKKAASKTKLAQLGKEIQDYDLAIRGAGSEFKLGRHVEAQRLLVLLDKLRSDSCLC